MLIITRRPGEKVMLGDDVVVEVIEVSGSSVRIGIAAPKSIPVYREEILPARAADAISPSRGAASHGLKRHVPGNIYPGAARARKAADVLRGARHSRRSYAL